MPSRRRKSHNHKVTAQAAAEEKEPKEKESRPPVRQVVEVVEEEVSASPFEETPSTQESERMNEEPPVSEPEPESEREPEEETTKKSMVEELYAPPRKSAVMPEISMHKNNGKKPLIVWAIVTIVVAILTGSILFAVSKKGSVPAILARPTPTPTPSPTPAPTPTPEPVDKTSYEIQVLNGGGVAGAAGKMKTFLEDKGYTVGTTGNTDEYTYDTTEIHTTASMSGAITTLTADLKDDYSLGTSDSDLPDDATYPVQIIVGKE